MAWCTALNDDFGRGVCQQHESPEGVPVRAFDTKAKAAKYARDLTEEAKRELNPFQFTYQDVDLLMKGDGDELALIAALEKQKLPSPQHVARTSYGSHNIDWPRWYDEIADSLTDAEREAIWNLLDRLELYRVVEVEFLLEM
jgi:hypothetical protein